MMMIDIIKLSITNDKYNICAMGRFCRCCEHRDIDHSATALVQTRRAACGDVSKLVIQRGNAFQYRIPNALRAGGIW